MRIFTATEMRDAEALAVKGGISYLELMERAGTACAEIIFERICENRKNPQITIVCGKGKNGGDGFVIARKLAESGYSPCVVLALGTPVAEDAVQMLAKLPELFVRVLRLDKNRDAARSAILKADVLIDALFGIGFQGVPNGDAAEAIDLMLSSAAYKIAIDTPSGAESDCGDVSGACVNADLTLAISVLKPVHVLYPSRAFCGEIEVVQVGVEESFYKDAPCFARTYNEAEVRALMPHRAMISNKGDFGRVLSVCGSRRYAGAAVFAAMGAVRSGAGLVFAAFPDCAYAAIGPQLPDTPLILLPSNMQGTFSVAAIPELLLEMKKANVMILGCGLGLNGDTREIVKTLLQNAEYTVIIDADGINALCGNIDILKEAHAPLILTPHPSEMSRLTGLSIGEVQQNRAEIAKSFARTHGVTLVLKGANTVVAEESGDSVYVNTTGNSGLAKGGSGDLLSGIVAGFVAQGVPDAAAVGVYVHGLSGDIAAERLSKRGMTPGDCLDALPFVLSKYE